MVDKARATDRKGGRERPTSRLIQPQEAIVDHAIVKRDGRAGGCTVNFKPGRSGIVYLGIKHSRTIDHIDLTIVMHDRVDAARPKCHVTPCNPENVSGRQPVGDPESVCLHAMQCDVVDTRPATDEFNIFNAEYIAEIVQAHIVDPALTVQEIARFGNSKQRNRVAARGAIQNVSKERSQGILPGQPVRRRIHNDIKRVRRRSVKEVVSRNGHGVRPGQRRRTFDGDGMAGAVRGTDKEARRQRTRIREAEKRAGLRIMKIRNQIN